MEIKFRQKGIGWCTVYTWANLLNEPGILRLCEDERFKGCGESEENEILQLHNPAMKIGIVAQVCPSYPILPIDFIIECLNREDEKNHFDQQCAIYCLSVRLIETIWHNVAVVKHHSGYYYLDPLKENWIKINDAEHLESMFIDCCSLSRPVMNNEKGELEYVSFNGSLFKYPFLET